MNCSKIFLFFFLALVVSFPAIAQDHGLPPLPKPLQNMVNEGAQLRYLGRDHGMDGWLMIKRGKEQYFYVLPDGKAMVMGVLFDHEGKAVTLEQIDKLRKSEGDQIDTLAQNVPSFKPSTIKKPTLKSPSARLYESVETANWVALGDKSAPYFYVFVDPQCRHCHDFINSLRPDYIEKGRMQVRIIPVGLISQNSLKQAAFLLGAADPAGRWMAHLDGDETALPVDRSVNTQGIQRNMGIMQDWKLDETPFSIYKSVSGEIKILRGAAKNPEQLLSDLAR